MADPNDWKTRQIKCMYTNADQLKNKMNELTDRIKLEIGMARPNRSLSILASGL